MAKKGFLSSLLGGNKTAPEKSNSESKEVSPEAAKAAKVKKDELQEKAIQIEINIEERNKRRIIVPEVEVEFIKPIAGVSVGTTKKLDTRTATALEKNGSVKILTK